MKSYSKKILKNLRRAIGVLIIAITPAVHSADVPLAVKNLYYRCYYRGPSASGEKADLAGTERVVIGAQGSKIDLQMYASPTASQKIILYFHGNGETLADISDLFILAQKEGVSIAAYDYPCFGRSQGVPSEETNVQAGVDVLKRIKAQFPQAKISLWGYSLGAGVAMAVYNRNLTTQAADVSSMVLVSPWDSFQKLCNAVSPMSIFCSSQKLSGNYYQLAAMASQVNVPTMVVYSKQDKLIPAAQSERVYSMIPKQFAFKIVEGGGGHNAIYTPDIFTSILKFLKEDGLPDDSRVISGVPN